MARSSRDTCTRSISWLAALACFAMWAHGQDPAALRVCADPANLPLSNTRGEGYENKIAELLARDLKRHVEFTFFPQRMGFVRNTLRQKDEATQQFKCDVIIGVPKGFELTATTQPYMRSTYALVFKSRPEFAQLESPEDLVKLPPAQLQALRIGVFGRSPGNDWLLRNGLLAHAVFYAPQSGDPAESTAHVIEQDLLAGKTDMAIVWGPIAGFLVGQHQGPAGLARAALQARPRRSSSTTRSRWACASAKNNGRTRSTSGFAITRTRYGPSWPTTVFRCSTRT
jgi:quinoprotein dehydrogenase-associated probable ABC transporter substrate-binding protein